MDAVILNWPLDDGIEEYLLFFVFLFHVKFVIVIKVYILKVIVSYQD